MGIIDDHFPRDIKQGNNSNPILDLLQKWEDQRTSVSSKIYNAGPSDPQDFIAYHQNELRREMIEELQDAFNQWVNIPPI